MRRTVYTCTGNPYFSGHLAVSTSTLVEVFHYVGIEVSHEELEGLVSLFYPVGVRSDSVQVPAVTIHLTKAVSGAVTEYRVQPSYL